MIETNMLVFMRSRDRADEAGSAGDANERIVCSLTIRRSFCFDAKFSSER
jgi:hypothetical protein